MIRKPYLWSGVLLLAQAASSQSFETGAVARSDGAKYHRNTIPQIARLGDGRLFTVWGVFAKDDANGRVVGAFSSDGGKAWSAPKLLFDDPQKNDGDPNMLVDGSKVFVYDTRTNIPNRIDKTWILAIRSEDNGATWSEPVEVAIPRQYVSGKQHNAIKLRDGTYAMGISWDIWPERGMAARTEGEMDLHVGMLLSKDGLKWNLFGDIHAFVDKVTPGSTQGMDEPSIVQLQDGEILLLLRSGGPMHYESRSRDGGVTWSYPAPSALTGHNTPTALIRLQQSPKEIVAVWNNSPTHRYPLSVALSSDGGRTFTNPRIIAEGMGQQVSYPGVCQTTDGTLVAVWQQALANGGRDVRWARFTREWVMGITR